MRPVGDLAQALRMTQPRASKHLRVREVGLVRVRGAGQQRLYSLDAAGDRNVAVLGGADIIQQCIRGGLLDELRLDVVHIVLGGGTAFFGGLDPADVALERIGLIDADGATHLTFRLAR
jgi:dihydrofolate reductase